MSAPNPARLLAIDTSTDRLCLAIDAGQGAQPWRLDAEGGAQSSARLVPAVLEGLAATGVSLQQLDAIAFARGPGAFTGLRTACSVAQGLALGAGKPVLALDSLLVVAEDAFEQAGRPEGFDLWVAADARMDEVYAARYRHEGTQWSPLAGPALYTLEALAHAWQAQPPAAVAGSALRAFADRLPFGPGPRFEREQDRALALMRIAQAAWLRGEAFDAALALPLYLRDKVALTTAEREQRAGASR